MSDPDDVDPAEASGERTKPVTPDPRGGYVADPAPKNDEKTNGEKKDDQEEKEHEEGYQPVEGLWDPDFAKQLGTAAVVAAGLLVLGLVILGASFGRGAGTAHKVTEWVDGSFADRARFYLALVLMAVGGVLLLMSGYLAALEVRAKLRSPDVRRTETVTPTADPNDPTTASTPVKEIVTAVTETIVSARATAIVAVAGVAVVGLAALTATTIDDGPPVEPAQTSDDSSSTAEPTEEPGVSDDSAETEPAPGDD